MSDNVKIKGLTSDNATLLLAAAEELGLEAGVVQTQSDGHFLVPSEVAKKAGFAKGDAEEVEESTTSRIAPEVKREDIVSSDAETSTPKRTAKKTAAKKTAAKKTAAKKTAASTPKE